MAISNSIKPLFRFVKSSEHMGQSITPVLHDNYNKELSESLIDATTDAEAIATFLTEFKDSPNTFRSYSKEVERLLLWCIHIGNVNIASLRRNHLLDYQAFLKSPTPKKQAYPATVNKLSMPSIWNKLITFEFSSEFAKGFPSP